MLFAIIAMTGRAELRLAADLYAVEVAITKASGAFEVLRRQRSSGSR